MERDAHEKLLEELLNPELEQSRKTEILQELRVDNGQVNSTMEDLNKNLSGLQKKHDDLVVSNSQLFRQVGITGNPDLEKKEEEKNFSETISLESIESRFKQ